MSENERKSVYGDMTPAEIAAYDAGQDALWEANHTQPAETQGDVSETSEVVDEPLYYRNVINGTYNKLNDPQLAQYVGEHWKPVTKAEYLQGKLLEELEALRKLNRPTYEQLEAQNAALTRELEAARKERQMLLNILASPKGFSVIETIVRAITLRGKCPYCKGSQHESHDEDCLVLDAIWAEHEVSKLRKAAGEVSNGE